VAAHFLTGGLKRDAPMFLSIRLIGWREYIEQDGKCEATIDDNVIANFKPTPVSVSLPQVSFTSALYYLYFRISLPESQKL
jgi:hypothetical protein